MNEQAHTIADPAADAGALLASLRGAGASRFDPVRWHYIEALARRAGTQHGSARRLLDAKLAQALAALQERFARAQCEAAETVARSAQQYPHAAGDLQRLLACGDWKGVQRLVATLQTGAQGAALGTLVRALEQHVAPQPGARIDGNTAPRAELKAVRNFRNTWARLSVDRQVAQALQQAPKNAGPINSHMLALRSLALMRDISPDYLNRFMAYAETLLCLDPGEKEKPAGPKKTPAAKAAKTAKK